MGLRLLQFQSPQPHTTLTHTNIKQAPTLFDNYPAKPVTDR